MKSKVDQKNLKTSVSKTVESNLSKTKESNLSKTKEINLAKTKETNVSKTKEINITKTKITIVGTGAFGTAVANDIVEIDSNEILLYGIDKHEISDINLKHKNTKYFHTKLNSKLRATSDPEEAFTDVDVIVLGIPSQILRDVLKNVIVPNLTKPAYFVNLSKGLDYLRLQLLSDLIEKQVPKELNKGTLKLSGPSFAIELVKKQPTLFTLAANSLEIANKVKPYFETSTSKIICSDNLRGIEAASVVKNPIAIILGIVKGLGYQSNAQAFIFTLALKEMEVMLNSLGINNAKDILLSSACVGDLLLTGTSEKSRNFSTGYKIGRANKVTKKILSTFTTVEGLRTIEHLIALAEKSQITLDLLKMLYNISYKKHEPKKTVENFFGKYKNIN